MLRCNVAIPIRNKFQPIVFYEGGDVYNAFTKYGFAWGGNAWHSKRDYMHFSYFGK